MTMVGVFFYVCAFDVSKIRQETATEDGRLVKLRHVLMTASCLTRDAMEKKLCQAELRDIHSDINLSSSHVSSLDVI